MRWGRERARSDGEGRVAQGWLSPRRVQCLRHQWGCRLKRSSSDPEASLTRVLLIKMSFFQ